MTNLAQSLDFVLTGRTVDGNAAPHAPIGFPRTVVMMNAFMQLARPLNSRLRWAFMDRGEFEAPATRLFASGARYLIRLGPARILTDDFSLDVWDAAHMISLVPKSTLLRQSYAWFVRRGRVYAAALADPDNVHESAVRRLTAAHQDVETLPSPYLCWGREEISLFVLRHPQLIFDEGLYYANCLATHFDDDLTHSDTYPAALAKLSYAGTADHPWNVFSLRRGETRLAVFATCHGVMDQPPQRSVDFTPGDEAILAESIASLRGTYLHRLACIPSSLI